MFTNICAFLLSFCTMGYIEYKCSHFNWKPVSLFHHIITASAANYLLYNEPDKIYNIMSYNISDYSLLYQYIPLISCAYGYFDLYHAIIDKKTNDFLFHGIFFVGTTSWMMYNNTLHMVYPGLLLETSSIFLTTINLHPFIKYPFSFSFLFYRNILFPYITIRWLSTMENLYTSEINNEKIAMTFVIMINVLNFYWGKKIIKKIQRHLHNE